MLVRKSRCFVVIKSAVWTEHQFPKLSTTTRFANQCPRCFNPGKSLVTQFDRETPHERPRLKMLNLLTPGRTAQKTMRKLLTFGEINTIQEVFVIAA